MGGQLEGIAAGAAVEVLFAGAGLPRDACGGHVRAAHRFDKKERRKNFFCFKIRIALVEDVVSENEAYNFIG